jgi:hypothetical protein
VVKGFATYLNFIANLLNIPMIGKPVPVISKITKRHPQMLCRGTSESQAIRA